MYFKKLLSERKQDKKKKEVFYLQTRLGFSLTNSWDFQGRGQQGPEEGAQAWDVCLSRTGGPQCSVSSSGLLKGRSPASAFRLQGDDAEVLPHLVDLSRPWEPTEAPGCCRDQCSLGLAGQDHLFPDSCPHPSRGCLCPLSYAPNAQSLSGLCYGDALQIPQPSPGPGLPPHQLRLPCPAIWVFSLVSLQLLPHPTDVPGSFPSPCLCSGHSWGPEHPFHLPTYTVSPPLLAQD